MEQARHWGTLKQEKKVVAEEIGEETFSKKVTGQ
jgi:hypothetical protein